ncbi:SRPBCC family protein [Fulvivirgaceae bacterium BMA10]|uniref:SRPBCC family protein n=1 Tax=Splendidivirga corallicola TaxID=3051826 RepID=A0ABT8KVG6_9BACT|nr:SRPBCC family protein [Fulvivirgaceae bacterium BMA10]
MKALKIIGIIVVVLVAIYFAAVAFSPSEMHVSRSIVINANAGKVFKEVSNFKTDKHWSVWHQMDPNASHSYEGPTREVGFKESWSSEMREVGVGSREITELEKDKMIKMVMAFEGYDGKPTATYLLEPDGEGTKLTWKFDEEGLKGFGKIMSLMMKGSIDDAYKKSLDNLKTYIESKPDYAIEIDEVANEAIYYVGIKSEVPANDVKAIQTAFANAYGQMMMYLQAQGQSLSGMPLCVYHNVEGETIVMEPGLPIATKIEVDHDEIKMNEIASGKAVKGVHMGDYVKLGDSHNEIRKYLADNNLNVSGNPWEIFVTDPGQVTDTAQWRTEIFYPIN